MTSRLPKIHQHPCETIWHRQWQEINSITIITNWCFRVATRPKDLTIKDDTIFYYSIPYVSNRYLKKHPSSSFQGIHSNSIIKAAPLTYNNYFVVKWNSWVKCQVYGNNEVSVIPIARPGNGSKFLGSKVENMVTTVVIIQGESRGMSRATSHYTIEKFWYNQSHWLNWVIAKY